MSKVVTFSRTFPPYHPKAGQPTYFVEKLWISLIQEGRYAKFYFTKFGEKYCQSNRLHFLNQVCEPTELTLTDK